MTSITPLDAALLVIDQEIAKIEDPANAGQVLAAVGAFILDRLGFMPDKPAEVSIDVGAEDPATMWIKVTWPVPAQAEETTQEATS
jgi:hypothetical protein